MKWRHLNNLVRQLKSHSKLPSQFQIQILCPRKGRFQLFELLVGENRIGSPLPHACHSSAQVQRDVLPMSQEGSTLAQRLERSWVVGTLILLPPQFCPLIVEPKLFSK